MAHFAELNKKNKVIKVLVFDDSFTNKNCTELLGGVWVKTSYNSNGFKVWLNQFEIEENEQP